MTKLLLMCFLLLLRFQVGAQNSWVKYLQSIKEQFYYKDTIIAKFQNGVQLDSSIKLVKVDTNYHKIFRTDKDTLRECKPDEMYFYSLYISKSNYSIIELYSGGMWGTTGNLYLYNFSPQGKLLKQIKLQDGWGDAGESYYTNSKFVSDSSFKVIHGDGFEKSDQSYNYKITECDYLIDKNGIILQKSKRKYKKKAE